MIHKRNSNLNLNSKHKWSVYSMHVVLFINCYNMGLKCHQIIVPNVSSRVFLGHVFKFKFQ
jgi:hypothetical protein